MKYWLDPRHFLPFIKHWKAKELCCILALDYGSKVTGIAISNETFDFATPYTCLSSDTLGISQSRDRILSICNEHSVAGIVVGWPLLPHGKPSRKCHEVESFIAGLMIELPTTFWDERGTTRATRVLRAAALKAERKKRKKAERLDDLSAAMILQDYLDYMKSLESKR